MEIVIDGLRSRVPQRAEAGAFSLSLEAGRVHALASLAEGGKSLVCRAVAGGDPLVTVRVKIGDEAPFTPASPRAALRRGVVTLYPRPLVFPALTALENLGIASPFSPWRLRRAVLPRAAALWERLGGGAFPADASGGELDPAAARRLEIVRALSGGSERRPLRMLVLNEALNAFDSAEKRRLFALLREQENLTVLFTTANPRAVVAADFVHVLHGGRLVSSPAGEDAVGETARALYGEETASREPLRNGKTVMEILGLVPAAGLPDYSLTLRQGEILGLTGLDGSGWERFGEILGGRAAARKGVLAVNGRNLRLARVTEAALRKAGIAVFDGRTRLPEGSPARALAAALDQRARELSAVLERADAAVYVISGLEISGEDAAAELLRRRVPELAAAGKAVILAGSNAEELLRWCNTLAVFHRGSLCPARAVEKWTREDLELFIDKGKGGMLSLL